nr:sulfatase-like hydrolase/transferase [Flectobacillus sp. BAB-3569]
MAQLSNCAFFAAVLIIPIRGGLQLAPINQSAVYFSNKLFANHAAINPLWNFADSWFNKTADKGNPYQYLPTKEAELEVSKTLHNSSPTTEYVIDTTITKPNVLIITWESLTAKVFDKTGGIKGVLPELGKIANEGILFRNCFASGDRSDKGLIAILSAFPAQPTASVMTMPKKTAHLPILSQDFKNRDTVQHGIMVESPNLPI